MNSTERVPATMFRSDPLEGFPEPDQHNILAHNLDRSMQASGDGMAASGAVPVIDVFAGPGGLGEGFSALRINGRPVFRIALSIEKDRDAHATLRLRSFFRQFAGGRVPEEYYRRLRGELTEDELYTAFPAEARRADQEAWRAELGGADTPPDLVSGRIHSALGGSRAWVLIGGPPCQAYSIAGRSRNRGIPGYRLEDDRRHRLYEEYLRIVATSWPVTFGTMCLGRGP